MGLKDRKQDFFQLRKDCEVIVRKHAFEDYPERGFSEREIMDLIRNGKGRYAKNSSPNAIEGSDLFFPKDGEERECQLVVKVESIEIEGEDNPETQIVVCSAYREI